MKKQEILKFAIKGIAAEIDELEKAIHLGRRFLNEIENGKQPKTKLSAQEIKHVIRQKQEKIEALSKKQFDLRWELNVVEE